MLMFRGLQRDGWVAVLLLATLGTLLVLVVRDYGVGIPKFDEQSRRSEPAAVPFHAERLASLLAASAVPQGARWTNQVSAFYTTHFVPPQPKPPTTRKVNMTYLGFVQSTDGRRRAFVRVGDDTVIGTLGSNVVADLALATIGPLAVTLTNRVAQTNQLEFNTLKMVEVPVQ